MKVYNINGPMTQPEQQTIETDEARQGRRVKRMPYILGTSLFFAVVLLALMSISTIAV